MKTTLGELKGFIRQQLSEGKDYLDKMQPGTSWMTRNGLISPEGSLDTYGQRGIDIPVMTRPTKWSSEVAAVEIPPGETVDVVDRMRWDQGWQDFGTSPVIEYQGQRYLIISDAPSDFSKPDHGAAGELTFDEAICVVLAQQGAQKAAAIMAAVGELKGLGAVPSSPQYLQTTLKKGLIHVARREGRSPIYELTEEGAALAADVQRELEGQQ
jgi:hypothetical protein